jgi:hypothetical protein
MLETSDRPYRSTAEGNACLRARRPYSHALGRGPSSCRNA